MAYFIDGLADELRKYGLKVEEVPGWKTRGYAGRGMTKVVGVMHHHTATSRSAFSRSDSPTLNMCTYGRAGLAGPLCHILFARDGTCHIVAAGWANHAGTGKWTDIPWHRGNDHTIGIEYESSGIRPWDWTAEQLYWAPRLGKALRLIFGINNDMSHAEYSDAGKIDTAGWPGGWDGLRKQISAVRFGGLQSDTVTEIEKDWSDMASKEEIAQVVREEIQKTFGDVFTVPDNEGTKESRKGNPSWAFSSVIHHLWVQANATKEDTRKILATLEQGHPDQQLTQEQVTRAVVQALTESLVNVDINVAGKQ